MAEPTIWKLEPHTVAKHAILRRYLDAWLPILTRWHGRVAYIDGFAGPGRYSGGEDGSPIVALKAALEHRSTMTAEFAYLFVEQDARRAANLNTEISQLRLPTNLKYQVLVGRFDTAVTEVLDTVQRVGGQIAPTFAFVDPFGWSGTPFSLMQRLLVNPRCEALINLNFEQLNRFIGNAEQEDNLDSLFGCPDWRDALLLNRADRRMYIRDLYDRQLRTRAGVRFVRSFEMRTIRNTTPYFLFFATNSVTGLEKMKDAMWRVDPVGTFRFSDATTPQQPVLFQPEADFEPLRRLVAEHYAGKAVSIDEIEMFVVTDTAFRRSHLREHVLRPLEEQVPPGLEVVAPPTGRRRGTFPKGTRLQFR